MAAEKIVNVSIRCGPDARKKVEEFADYGIHAVAHRFVCKDCLTSWDRHDFCGAYDLAHVVCSNCYGTNVLIAQVSVQDFREEVEE